MFSIWKIQQKQHIQRKALSLWRWNLCLSLDDFFFFFFCAIVWSVRLDEHVCLGVQRCVATPAVQSCKLTTLPTTTMCCARSSFVVMEVMVVTWLKCHKCQASLRSPHSKTTSYFDHLILKGGKLKARCLMDFELFRWLFTGIWYHKTKI